MPKLRDFGVQNFKPILRKLACTAAILAGVERKKLLDFLKCEPSRLRLPDKAKATHVVLRVVTYSSVTRWGLEQAPALVETDRFNAYVARCSKSADCQPLGPLTLYHGTDPISSPGERKTTRKRDMSATVNSPSTTKTAVVHRMVMADHTCPYGLKAKDLLKRSGFEVEDRHLTSRDETDAFKAQHGVATTPQIFIEGKRVGGYDDLRRFLGKPVADPKATSYRPVVVLFAMTALMALAASYAVTGSVLTIRAGEWFIGFSMIVLALLKLQNVESFATMFLNYDLLAKRWVPYSYIYPFAEGFAGVLMVAGVLTWLSVPVALFIGTIGALSVFKAVYIDKRELKCACVGGSSNVPLGFISLTENLMMIAMAIWMILPALGVPLHAM